jgi:DNA-binding protein YbaB
VKINLAEDEVIEIEDCEMLEDMIMVAFNEAIKKANEDKEKKMGKYGQGLAGLM